MKIVNLLDICNPKQWKTVSRTDLSEKGYPCYSANGKIGFYKEYNHESPALLIGCRGTCGSLHITEPFSYTSANAMALDNLNTNLADIKFLFYFFKNRGFKDIITGSSQPQITRQGLQKIQIPLPPLEDQKRIVKILDEAEKLRQKRKLAIALLDDYLKSVFLEMFGDPVKNEKGWERIPLSKILSKIESGHSPVCLNRPVMSGEWGVLKLGAVTKCVYNPAENKALPDTEKPNSNIEIRTGDILFSRKNTYELVAACAYVWETPFRLMMSDLIFRLVLRDEKLVNPIFLQALLSFSSKRKMIQKMAGGAAGSMPNISKAKLFEHKIEVPPFLLQEQFAIVARKTESLKYKMISQSEELETQFQALVQKGFRGEL
jgi:type I restriction enzyme S subunit